MVKNISGQWRLFSPINIIAKKIYSFIPKSLFERVAGKVLTEVDRKELGEARTHFEEGTCYYSVYIEGEPVLNKQLQEQVLECFRPVAENACSIDGCGGLGGREGGVCVYISFSHYFPHPPLPPLPSLHPSPPSIPPSMKVWPCRQKWLPHHQRTNACLAGKVRAPPFDLQGLGRGRPSDQAGHPASVGRGRVVVPRLGICFGSTRGQKKMGSKRGETREDDGVCRVERRVRGSQHPAAVLALQGPEFGGGPARARCSRLPDRGTL